MVTYITALNSGRFLLFRPIPADAKGMVILPPDALNQKL